MKLSRNKIRKLYKQRNQSLKRVKHYNKPKQYKKYTTFRRKQTDASTLISANNSHDSDNLTINRLSHLFKKTLKTYIPKYELSRLIKKYKNKRTEMLRT